MNTLHKLILMTLTLPLLAACADSYPGLDYEIDQSKGVSKGVTNFDEVPLMVFISDPRFLTFSSTATEDASTRHETRGSGAIGETTESSLNDNITEYVTAGHKGESNAEAFLQRLQDMNIHLFGFRAYKSADLTRQLKDEANKQYDNCILDGSRQSTPSELGLKGHIAQLEDGMGSITWDDRYDPETRSARYFFSREYPTKPYHFFAYHIDDAPYSRMSREASMIKFEDLRIDGATDLMCGTSVSGEKFKDYVRRTLGIDDLNNADKTRRNQYDHLINYGGFTTQAASNGVYPYVEMQHQLTRLVFTARAAAKLDTDGTNGTSYRHNSWISIENVYVRAQTTGDFVVAARGDYNEDGTTRTAPQQYLGFYPKGEKENVYLHKETTEQGKSGDGGPDGFSEPYKIVWEAGKSRNQQQMIYLGESLMLPPDSRYELTICYTQHWEDAEGNPQQSPVQRMNTSINAQETSAYKDSSTGEFMYLKGHQYNININVYGLADIRVVSAVTAWQQGDDVTPIDEETMNWP